MMPPITTLPGATTYPWLPADRRCPECHGSIAVTFLFRAWHCATDLRCAASYRPRHGADVIFQGVVLPG